MTLTPINKPRAGYIVTDTESARQAADPEWHPSEWCRRQGREGMAAQIWTGHRAIVSETPMLLANDRTHGGP
jgi:hypothetical protein